MSASEYSLGVPGRDSSKVLEVPRKVELVYVSLALQLQFLTLRVTTETEKPFFAGRTLSNVVKLQP